MNDFWTRVANSAAILFWYPALGALGAGLVGGLLMVPLMFFLVLFDSPRDFQESYTMIVVIIGAFVGFVAGVFHIRETYWSS